MKTRRSLSIKALYEEPQDAPEIDDAVEESAEAQVVYDTDAAAEEKQAAAEEFEEQSL